MKYTKKLIEERIGWLKTIIKNDEKHLDELLKNAENLSGHLKEDVAELKELSEALKNLRG